MATAKSVGGKVYATAFWVTALIGGCTTAYLVVAAIHDYRVMERDFACHDVALAELKSLEERTGTVWDDDHGPWPEAAKKCWVIGTGRQDRLAIRTWLYGSVADHERGLTVLLAWGLMPLGPLGLLAALRRWALWLVR